MNHISFPNIGLDFNVNEVAFSIFGKDIAWYGIIVTLGIISAVLYVYYKAKKHYIVTDDFLDIAIFTVVFSVVGARLYYVLTSLDQYDSFWDVFKVWEGGLGIYGGIIAGAVAAICTLLYKKMNVLKFFNGLAPACMLGQIIGRWGNFVNAEAYGSVDTFEFFGRTYDISGCQELPWIMEANGILCQPTFLYECVWNIIGFVLINIFYNKKKYDGQPVLWYLGWYGFGRMFIEGLRTDSLYVGGVKISQLIGLVCVIVCVSLLILFRIKNVKNDKPLYREEKTVEVKDGNID
ncbi:MAG: prolipoprotein diacylglyceryl transferase [Clostridia bacterium]|nr:prolipoprotein diacylglyceryl transferase [Clostridia bacterium]